MDFHAVSLVINGLVAIVCTVLGYILRTVWEAQVKLNQDVKEIEIRLGTLYLTKEDHRYATDRLLDRFDRLEARLEQILTNNQKGH